MGEGVGDGVIEKEHHSKLDEEEMGGVLAEDAVALGNAVEVVLFKVVEVEACELGVD